MPRRTSGKSSWKTLFRLPAFLFANVALVVVIGISTIRQTYRGWSVDREIATLEQQAEQLEGRRMKLETLADKLVSEEYVESEARAKLGRQRPGERVVVLYGYSASHTWTGDDVFGTESPVAREAPDDRTNVQKWLDYFKGTSNSE